MLSIYNIKNFFDLWAKIGGLIKTYVGIEKFVFL